MSSEDEGVQVNGDVLSKVDKHNIGGSAKKGRCCLRATCASPERDREGTPPSLCLCFDLFKPSANI
jgi:hypothetical protein